MNRFGVLGLADLGLSLSGLRPAGPRVLTLSDDFNPAGVDYRGMDISLDGTSLDLVAGSSLRHSRVRYKGFTALRGVGLTDLTLSDLDIAHVAQPLGVAPHATDTQECIVLSGCIRPRLERIKTAGGSSGIFVTGGSDLYANRILGYNPFGPFPRGQVLQAAGVHNVTLGNINAITDMAHSYPEDLVSLYECTGVLTIFGDWLLDGNNSQNGVGYIEESCNWDEVIIIPGTRRDAVHQGCGGFTWAGTADSISGDVRVRDVHSAGQGGRPAPSSGGNAFGSFDYSGDVASNNLITGRYYNIPNEIIYDAAKDAPASTYTQEDFTPLAPLSLTWPWQDWKGGPFLLVLNGPDNTGSALALTSATTTGTSVGLLHAESGDPAETFTYSIASDPSGYFSLTGALVKSVGTLVAGSYNVTFRVTGSRGGTKDLVYTFVVAAAVVNLFSSPSDISNAYWTKTNVTVSESQADDVGGTAAEGIRETTATNEHWYGKEVSKASSVKNYQVRVKFKGVNRSRFIIFVYNSTYTASAIGYFFQAGLSFQGGGAGLGTPTGSITAIGDGYFECVMNFTSDAGSIVPIRFHMSDADYSQVYTGVAANGGNVLEHRLYAV